MQTTLQKTRNKFNFLFCILLVTACSTSYGPRGATGGYDDKELEPGVYKITSVVNAHTPKEKAEEYWNKRASELCHGRPYDHDEQLSTISRTDFNRYAGELQEHVFPYVTGIAKCK
ncbi:MAG TPA: hypothetical protein VIE69_02525 [Methylophilaceae bacterium]|jgi:hypothetical protein